MSSPKNKPDESTTPKVDHPASLVITQTHQAPRIDGYVHVENSSVATEVELRGGFFDKWRDHALIRPFFPDDRIKWAVYLPVEMVNLKSLETIRVEPPPERFGPVRLEIEEPLLKLPRRKE